MATNTRSRRHCAPVYGPFTTTAAQALPWPRPRRRGDHELGGDQHFRNEFAWALRVVWDEQVVRGDLTRNRVVWGDLTGLSIAPTALSWGNLERANGDLVTR